jgi:hypothetical protein
MRVQKVSLLIFQIETKMIVKKNIFIKIDEFIFQKLDLLKNDSGFSKINEFMQTLEEQQQRIFTQAVTFGFILIPFVIVFSIWWSNSKIKQGIQTKNQILEQIAQLNANKSALMTVSNNYIAPFAISTQSDLDNKIRAIMTSNNIDSKKANNRFNLVSTTSSVTKIEAIINFHDFGTQDFSNFLRNLTENERFKVTKVNLSKNTSTNLLQGELTLLHIGKNNSY